MLITLTKQTILIKSFNLDEKFMSCFKKFNRKNQIVSIFPNRDQISGLFLSLLDVVWWNHCFWCMEYLMCLFGLEYTCAAGEIRARTVNLAQASRTRLSESDKGSPHQFARKVSQATHSNFWASKQLAQARGVSPKRDPALLSCFRFEPSPRRRGTRLSETPQPERGAGRDNAVIGCLFISGWSVLVGYECMMRDMYMREYDVYVAWFMNYKWWVGMKVGMRTKWVGHC